MRHLTFHKYYELNGKIWSINSIGSGCYTHILKSIVNQLDIMTMHHNKVLMIRFDLHCKNFHSTNEIITKFNKQLFRQLKSEYKFIRIGFVWVREQDEAKQQHYHYALLLDGNKVKYPARIISTIETLWKDNGSHWLPENSYILIHRGSHEELQQAIYRLSYLSKGRSKDTRHRPQQTKNFGTSRIKLP